MFDTTLTGEYLHIANTFNFNVSQIKQFVLNGIRASLLSSEKKQMLEKNFQAEFIELENKFGLL